ncbi:DoxX family protein [Pseudonocardia sp. NPDC049635]|uniref:DoxX family protein n=1 Tax=Pseudonocardia sp. NPDC049635 TaxID=3155506 RepID=UPI0033F09384
MNTILWAAAIVLAAVFFTSGTLKVALSKEKLRAAGRIRGRDGAAWTEEFSPVAIKAIGVLELLAAIGLVAPPLVGIAPVLVPLAALGLVVIMVGAAVTHLRRKEHPHVVINLAYLALAAVVVWGRLAVEPFTA